ncbi:hypothetical protein SK128_014011, partial [Halocaridina rubra]
MVSDSKDDGDIQLKKIKNGFNHTKIDIEPNGIDTKLSENGKSSSKDKEEEEEEKKDDLPPVPILQLFRYSTSYERFLMVVGIIAAILGGVCMPIMFILFGTITDAFVYHGLIESINNETLPGLVIEYPEIENMTVDEVKELLTDLLDVGDFFTQVIIFGAGTIGIGVAQMLFGYIFVATMNYAAEGQ